MTIAEPYYSRIHELANFIEEAIFEFDMEEARVNLTCGTAGCIAGHAAVLWPDVRAENIFNDSGPETFSWDEERLNEHLGLDNMLNGRLFYVNPHLSTIWKRVDRAKAVDTLRRYAETGVVDFQFTEEQLDFAKRDYNR